MYQERCRDDKHYYSILNIDVDSTNEQIKKAYRKQAIIYHPDKNNGDDKQFKKIQEAYDILSDSTKKHIYDNNIDEDQMPFPEDMMSGGGTTFFTTDPSEIIFHFEELFGNIMSDEKKQRAKNASSSDDKTKTRYEIVTLSLDDVIYGCDKQITYTCDVVCGHCMGEGTTYSGKIHCITCQGRGYIDGFPFPSICRSCNGNAIIKTNLKQCTKCQGNGTISKELTFELNIMPGKENNSELFVREHDMYVRIKHVFSNKNISLRKRNIHVKHKITIEEMLCGFKHFVILGSKDKCITLQKDGYFDVKVPMIFDGMGVYMQDGTRGAVILSCCVEGTNNKDKLIRFKPAFDKIFK
jgi:molecular chaperone DnaJ